MHTIDDPKVQDAILTIFKPMLVPKLCHEDLVKMASLVCIVASQLAADMDEVENKQLASTVLLERISNKALEIKTFMDNQENQ